MASSKKDVTTTMSTLTIDSKKTSKKTKQPVADSWEDSDPSDPDTPTDTTTHPKAAKGTSAPPPTPISPTYNNKATGRPWSPATEPTLEEPDDPSRPRPEKTDAVARRMIAGALGLRAPKLTEEQRAYDKAIREQERKRREEEKEKERKRLEEVEKAKAAIWDE